MKLHPDTFSIPRLTVDFDIMFPEAILLTIAEIAVAVVGFSGVVAVYGHRGQGDWTLSELLQFRTLVEPSLFVLFGALTPGTIQLLTESEMITWRLTSTVFGVFEIIALTAFLVRTRSVTITTGQRILMYASFLMLGALWLAAFGLIPWVSFICVLALLHGLLVGVYNFTLLLFQTGKF